MLDGTTTAAKPAVAETAMFGRRNVSCDSSGSPWRRRAVVRSAPVRPASTRRLPGRHSFVRVTLFQESAFLRLAGAHSCTLTNQWRPASHRIRRKAERPALAFPTWPPKLGLPFDLTLLGMSGFAFLGRLTR